uniref:Chlorophyll(Ide) b reductase n=1 Tax=Timspurckia oligopyrenoides TaxID=708627 RepID=A0A7S0ZFH5_9RHOD|mmetsp:Transcript_3368/g.5902  ORF Transcript_3368/g.5902 Transcript_3368/m.5902 type:complete len:338 (+) Transcript_3368:42-1055(+)
MNVFEMEIRCGKKNDLCFGLNSVTLSAKNDLKMLKCVKGNRNRNVVSMKVVVITGGSKGLGYALAKQSLKFGHTTIIGARNTIDLETAENALKRFIESEELKVKVYANQLDVSDSQSIEQFTDFVLSNTPQIDIWVNNAGSNSNVRRPLFNQTAEQITQVVDTNLKGTLLCCRNAICVMKVQENGGHIFNTDGAGVFGTPTPGYAAYGATKRAIPQLMSSLNAELKKEGIDNVGVHTISPGLVLTELLLADSTREIRVFMNFLAEEPDSVAEWLMPKILETKGKGKYHKYLKIPQAFVKIGTGLVFRWNRYFDVKGKRIVKNPDLDQFTDSGTRKIL